MDTYEKKYNEALEKAKQIRKYSSNLAEIKQMEDIFPELAKSEDERTRKEILNVFKQLGKDTTICGRNYDYAKWISWLEKQGEKKSPDEVLKIRQELYQSGYNDGYKHGCEDTQKQGEQKLANSAKTCKKSQRMVSAEAKEALYDKPAWSEEDEDTYNRVYCLFRDANDAWYKAIFSGCYPKITRDKVLTILKSLKPQPKQIWSEEDEEMLDGIILRCEKYGHQEQINWLKSIKQRIKGE